MFSFEYLQFRAHSKLQGQKVEQFRFSVSKWDQDLDHYRCRSSFVITIAMYNRIVKP